MLIETLNSANSAISYSCPNPAYLLQREFLRFLRAVAKVWQAHILSALKDVVKVASFGSFWSFCSLTF